MTRYLHLPAIQGNSNVIQGQSDIDNAHLFVTAWLLRLGERARIMQSDARLMTAAREHATWLAQRQDMTPSLHIGLGNSTPNQRVAASGYALPSWYKPDRNNVEASAVHHDGPVQAFELMLTSQAHRQLVLAEKVNDWFWHLHVCWGLGVASPFYVLLAAPKENTQ